MTFEEITEQDFQFIVQSLSMNSRIKDIDLINGVVEFKWTWVTGNDVRTKPENVFSFDGYEIKQSTLSGIYRVTRHDHKPYVPKKIQGDYDLKKVQDSIKNFEWRNEVYENNIINGWAITADKIKAGTIKADTIKARDMKDILDETNDALSKMIWYDKETGKFTDIA